MADNTKIEWADATVNYVNGCSVISAGCTNCYAMREGRRNLPNHPSTGLTRPTKAGHVWTGEVRANEKMLQMVLRWKTPRRIFWNAHGDLFHENVPDAWIDRQFAVMALTPQHTHMVLTKRPERMRAYLEMAVGRIDDAMMDLRKTDDLRRMGLGPNGIGPSPFGEPGARWFPLPNVWLGTSVEDQRAADERIPHLLATPAAVRFLSCEPLLGPVDLRKIELRPFGGRTTELSNRLGDYVQPLRGNFTDSPRIHWVIAGGESGPGARPMHPDWARSLRDQCAAAGVAFFMKQWGEWAPAIMRDGVLYQTEAVGAFDSWKAPVYAPDCEAGVNWRRLGKARAGRLLDGRTHDDFPGSAA